MRMKIYADKRYLPDGLTHAPMLYPFWGFVSQLNVSELDSYVFQEYLQQGASFFELTTMDEAQVAVLPFQWEQIFPGCLEFRFDLDLYGQPRETMLEKVSEAEQVAFEIAEEAGKHGKPVAVFFVDDNETLTIPLPGAFTFRPSIIGSRRGPNEFAVPSWVRDEVAASFDGELPLRQKSDTPIVGFCGVPGPLPGGYRSELKYRLAANPSISRAVARLGVELLPQHQNRARAQGLYQLSRSKDVQHNFIYCKQWYNGTFIDNRVNVPLLIESRKQYVANMLASNYILCARGVGNYTIRLYETLCLGRIPVFINTDCVLPFDRWIDWKQYCVWVEEKDLPHIADRILEFHERLSPGQFQDLQRECRRLWVEWLSPHGFFQNFYRHFE